MNYLHGQFWGNPKISDLICFEKKKVLQCYSLRASPGMYLIGRTEPLKLAYSKEFHRWRGPEAKMMKSLFCLVYQGAS